MMSFTVWVALLSLAAPVPPPEREADTRQVKADQAAFQAYLRANKLEDRWQGDAAPLNAPELRKAYPGLRAYFTYAAPPLPPGAFLPELVERHRRAMEEHKKHSLRITVLIGEKVVAMSKPEDFNTGLMAITGADDARVAAAAILSMIDAGHVPPGPVDARDIQVASSDKGWTCTFSRPMRFDGKVTFNGEGKCIAVAKRPNFIPPLPPSAPPRGPGGGPRPPTGPK
jgi:hypothetical protein